MYHVAIHVVTHSGIVGNTSTIACIGWGRKAVVMHACVVVLRSVRFLIDKHGVSIAT